MDIREPVYEDRPHVFIDIGLDFGNIIFGWMSRTLLLFAVGEDSFGVGRDHLWYVLRPFIKFFHILLIIIPFNFDPCITTTLLLKEINFFLFILH